VEEPHAARHKKGGDKKQPPASAAEKNRKVQVREGAVVDTQGEPRRGVDLGGRDSCGGGEKSVEKRRGKGDLLPAGIERKGNVPRAKEKTP